MVECKKCNSTGGYYTKYRISGVIETHFNCDHTEADNSEMYEHIDHKEFKKAYCTECHACLGDVENVRKR